MPIVTLGPDLKSIEEPRHQILIDKDTILLVLSTKTPRNSWGRQRPLKNWEDGQDTQKTKTPNTERSRERY